MKIVDEKLAWPSRSQVDDFNEEYVEHKQRVQAFPKRVQSFPQERPRVEKSQLDHRNSEFIEHKKRQKTARLPVGRAFLT